MSKTSRKLVLRFFLHFLLSVLIALPVCYAAVALTSGRMRHGIKFFELNFKSALLVASAFGFLIAFWNFLEHSRQRKMDREQLMRSFQTYRIKLASELKLSELGPLLMNNLPAKKRWAIHEEDPEKLLLTYRFYLWGNDVITIKKENEHWLVESRPVGSWWYMDFGRNYRHIVSVAKVLKEFGGT